jgi:Spy/CpxP family protein refolding chaperone
VLPPPLKQELRLSEEQEKQIADLEKEVKAKLMKILTDEQKRKLEDMRQRGPGGPPPGDRPPPRPERPD